MMGYLKEIFQQQGKQNVEKQKLTINSFGKLKKIEWISEIEFDKNREAEMESFYDSNNVSELDSLLE